MQMRVFANELALLLSSIRALEMVKGIRCGSWRRSNKNPSTVTRMLSLFSPVWYFLGSSSKIRGSLNSKPPMATKWLCTIVHGCVGCSAIWAEFASTFADSGELLLAVSGSSRIASISSAPVGCEPCSLAGALVSAGRGPVGSSPLALKSLPSASGRATAA